MSCASGILTQPMAICSLSFWSLTVYSAMGLSCCIVASSSARCNMSRDARAASETSVSSHVQSAAAVLMASIKISRFSTSLHFLHKKSFAVLPVGWIEAVNASGSSHAARVYDSMCAFHNKWFFSVSSGMSWPSLRRIDDGAKRFWLHWQAQHW